MTRLQITTPEAIPEESSADAALRPSRLDEFVGQTQVKSSLQIAIDAARNAERDDELRVVQDLLETASNGGRAVGGRESVLHELLKGSIRQLIVADDLQVEGSVCRTCGRLVAIDINRCPACGGDLAPFDDIFDEAIRRTLKAGRSVEIVNGPAADALLTQSGGIAARLRFRSATLAGAVQAS